MKNFLLGIVVGVIGLIGCYYLVGAYVGFVLTGGKL